jgi:hypothetical protein
MAIGKRGAPTGTAGPAGRRRRAPTIELTATEVATAARNEEAARAGRSDAAEGRGGPAGQPTASAAPADSERPRAAEQNRQEERTTSDNAGAAPGAPWLVFAREQFDALMAIEHRRPLVAGAVAGAAAILLVFAAVWAVGLFASRDSATAALDSRFASLEQQVRDIGGRPAPASVDPKALDDLSARLGKIETTLASPKSDPALASRLTGIESALRSVGDRSADVSRRIDSVAAAVGTAKTGADAAAAAARDAKTRADEAAATARDAQSRADAAAGAATAAQQNAERAGRTGIERSDIESLANRIAALESSTKILGEQLAQRAPGDNAGDRAERLAISAEAMRAAIDRGEPFGTEFLAVKALAPDPKGLAVLEPFAVSGVPGATVLVEELKVMIPFMRRAARTTTGEGGVLDKLQASAERLVRIRRIGEPAAGDDPDTVIARIETKAATADLAGLLGEIAKLSETARAPAAAWIKKVEARNAAIAESRRLAADALAALGKSVP